MTTQTADIRAGALAVLIRAAFRDTSMGHCVRVDHLPMDVARAVCEALRSSGTTAPISAYLLSPSAGIEQFALTVDQAIEKRNRKNERLCVFVPADLVDATVSSLGNSFAQLNGQTLYRQAIERAVEDLEPDVREAYRDVVRALRGTRLRPGEDALFDFAVAVQGHEDAGTPDAIGRELWRVGLIADAGTGYRGRLGKNRDSVLLLAHPSRLSASLRDRIADLQVDSDTEQRIERFFTGRSILNVHDWSRDLGEQGLTFDTWIFPARADNDLVRVDVEPFMDAHGKVKATTKLLQPDGPGATLFAQYGTNRAIAVKWITEPTTLTSSEHIQWRVALVPDVGDAIDVEEDDVLGDLLDLPVRDSKGSARSTTLKMDIDVDDAVRESPFRVRVAALDASGDAILDIDRNPIAAVSEPFYLSNDFAAQEAGLSMRRRTVPTLAQGRLDVALRTRAREINLAMEGWTSAEDLTYYAARANERDRLTVGYSTMLSLIEQRTLGEPAQGGRWHVDLDEVRLATGNDVRQLDRPVDGQGDFWQQRRLFFERLRKTDFAATAAKSASRAVIATVNWVDEIAEAAKRYAQAYSKALNEAATEAVRRDLLTVDTVTVSFGAHDGVEKSVIVLPTHPLRALWFAVHGLVLAAWERQLLETKAGISRSGLIDMGLLSDVQPVNMPAFAFANDAEEPFIFHENLGMFYGVALPASAPDPRRRFLDLAQAFGYGSVVALPDDSRVARLAERLAQYRDAHPYADPLRLALVNPDGGTFVGSALGKALPVTPIEDGDEQLGTIPALELHVYSPGDSVTPTLEGLDRVRQQQAFYQRDGDALRPALTLTTDQVTTLGDYTTDESHLTVVTDLSTPKIALLPVDMGDDRSSVGVYGLVTRFVSDFVADAHGMHWRSRIAIPSTARTEPQVMSPSFTDTMIGLQAAIQGAMASSLSEDATDHHPALVVTLSPEARNFLDAVHAHADWVVTLDRFFGLEYYDSPENADLRPMARTYLLDYSPEFVEGMGHRTIVTTSRAEEVRMVLQRATRKIGMESTAATADHLLAHLKTISGGLALRALRNETDAAEAVGLAMTVAWLKARKRLQRAILVPIDPHRALFGARSSGPAASGERRCDLALFSLRQGSTDVTFIEVKWRSGALGNPTALVDEMVAQMEGTRAAFEQRCVRADRVDGVLHRAYLAAVLRYHCVRAARHGLLTEEDANATMRQIARLERLEAEWNTFSEGFIVCPEESQGAAEDVSGATVRVLGHQEISEAMNGKDSVPPGVPTAPSGARPAPPGIPLPSQPLRSPPPGIPSQMAQEMTSVGASLDKDAEEARASVSSTSSIFDAISTGAAGQLATDSPPDDPEVRPTSESVEVVLGRAGERGITWKPRTSGNPHLFITGMSGMGKSETATRILVELHRQNIPALVFDVHGQFGDQNNPYVRVADPPVMDAAAGLPFSPFETNGVRFEDTARSVSEILRYICGLGDQQRDALEMTIRHAYRSRGYKNGDPQSVLPTPRDVLRRLEQAHEAKIISRCRWLLEESVFQPVVGAAGAFERSLREGMVVRLDTLTSDNLRLAASAFILQKLYRSMFAWGPTTSLRLAVVLDEAHRLARDTTLPLLMREARKYGVIIVAASQGLQDFHVDVVQNAGSKIAFRTSASESRKVARYFTGTAAQDLVRTLETLPVGTALVQTIDMSSATKTTMTRVDV